MIEELVLELARMLAERPLHVIHGPRGIGIQIVNTIHNVCQQRALTNQMVFVERDKIVAPADFVLVVGGSRMTATEVEIAISLRKKLIPIPASGGTARRCHDRLLLEPELFLHWTTERRFRGLADARSADAIRRTVAPLLYDRPIAHRSTPT